MDDFPCPPAAWIVTKLVENKQLARRVQEKDSFTSSDPPSHNQEEHEHQQTSKKSRNNNYY